VKLALPGLAVEQSVSLVLSAVSIGLVAKVLVWSQPALAQDVHLMGAGEYNNPNDANL
jgi:hypothetical protein